MFNFSYCGMWGPSKPKQRFGLRVFSNNSLVNQSFLCKNFSFAIVDFFFFTFFPKTIFFALLANNFAKKSALSWGFF